MLSRFTCEIASAQTLLTVDHIFILPRDIDSYINPHVLVVPIPNELDRFNGGFG